MASSTRYDVFYDIPEKPDQLHHLSFPSQRFGKASPVLKSFQLVWFNRFKWLHYDIPRNAAFCYACCSALKAKLITPLGVMEATFVHNGYALTG